MILRQVTALGLCMVFFGVSAGAQRAHFGAAGFRGGAGMQAHSSPARSFTQAPQNSHFRSYSPNFFSHGGRGFPLRPRGRGFGYSPYFFGGFGNFGYPYFYTPAYGPGYDCDPRFSSSPYDCQPFDPNGPPTVDPEGYQGDDSKYARPGGESSHGAGDLTSSSGYDARRVVITYDGHPQSLASASGPLVVTSGSHQIIVSAKPK
jgi:hypothetical protein